MEIKQLSPEFSVSAQITSKDLAQLQAQGITTLIGNRPDGEGGAEQPAWDELTRAAEALGIKAHLVPVVFDTINSADVRRFAALLQSGERIHAFCRSGARSTALWALARVAQGETAAAVVEDLRAQGTDLATLPTRFATVIEELDGSLAALPLASHCPLLIVGGGAAGISLASSLLKRETNLDITIIDPASKHYYQPGFTMVGGGIFDAAETVREEAALIPHGVQWIQSAVTHILPELNQVVLANQTRVSYDRLAVCPGLQLNFAAVEGLEETLGKNGVTSNYRYDLAPYTWELVKSLKRGTALFTQPPMPIKCAGAPQKALYLSADHWLRNGALADIDVRFCNAGGALFGVKEYVPALMKYVERYNASLQFGHNLVKVNGPAQIATFATTDADGKPVLVEQAFDMLHVCPPQCAPDFIRNSAIADRAGWVSVDPQTLQHPLYANIWSLGDVCNAPNAKTAAAVRKQAPIVACNMLADLRQQTQRYHYDGYGACPLTVENGRVVLAEFGYGGKLLPSLPRWLLEGTVPTRLAWLLKKLVLPKLYWDYMLKGREPLVKPENQQL